MGIVDPDRMLADMPGRLWAQWCEYWQAEPWGEERADLRSAMVARLLHAGFGFKPARPRLDDFMIVRPPRPSGGRERVRAFFDAQIAKVKEQS